MIQKNELARVLDFVARRWIEVSRDEGNKAMKSLPSDFWMNSVGGKAGRGRWITTLMYTESEEDAEAFKEVLLRWQSKGMREKDAPDLIQIGKK